MGWDDFFTGANSTFDQGANIGADVYLKKLAAKIQARNQDKQNLWESIKAEKDKADKAAEWDRQQRITSETNQRWTQTQAERTANEQFDAVNYLIDAKGYRDKIGEFPKTTAGVEAAKARMKELDEAAKPKDKQSFNADETLYNLLGPQKWLEYKTKGGDVPHEAAMAAAKQNVERQVKPKEEAVSNLQNRLDESYTAADSSAVQPLLDKAVHERDSTYQANPLIDEYQKIRGANQQVSPEQAASVTQELATLKQQLAELLKSLGAKQ